MSDGPVSPIARILASSAGTMMAGRAILMGAIVGVWRRCPEKDGADVLAWRIEPSQNLPESLVWINQRTGEVTIVPLTEANRATWEANPHEQP